jgi:hypothetical protein
MRGDTPRFALRLLHLFYIEGDIKRDLKELIKKKKL